MTVRFYLIPIDVVNNRRGPKYLKWRENPTGLDVPWSMMDYGLVNTALVAADVTSPQHNQLAQEVDVTAIPANIDDTVSTQALATVRSELEALNIPGNWVTTSHTYREILRVVAGLFQFAQRHHGLHNKIVLPNENNMDQNWGDLPAAVRSELAATADSFGYDTSGVTASTPIRAILKNLADQWGEQEFNMGITTL